MGLSLEEIEKIQGGLFPAGSIEIDNDGQVVIYTGVFPGKEDCPHIYVQKVGFNACQLCDEEF